MASTDIPLKWLWVQGEESSQPASVRWLRNTGRRAEVQCWQLSGFCWPTVRNAKIPLWDSFNFLQTWPARNDSHIPGILPKCQECCKCKPQTLKSNFFLLTHFLPFLNFTSLYAPMQTFVLLISGQSLGSACSVQWTEMLLKSPWVPVCWLGQGPSTGRPPPRPSSGWEAVFSQAWLSPVQE